jgi:hypothetical protein
MLCVKVVDGCDAGVIQFGECHSFSVQKLSRVFMEDGSLVENFNSDFAVEVFILGAIHLTHATGTDLFEDAVAAECLADEGILR